MAITGVSGQLGGTLARLLERDDRVKQVLGLDIRPSDLPLEKLHFVHHDVCQPGLTKLLRTHGVTHVAHFAFLLDTIHDRERARRIDVEGSRRVLQAARAVGAAKVVFTSSSVVYGAHRDNPPFIPEDHPRRPHPGIQYTQDKVVVEDLCLDLARRDPRTGVVVLRPVTIVGPRMANFLSRTLDKPVLVTARGYDPPWQVVHEEDCARAAQLMLFNDRTGVYNLGADDPVPFSELARLGGRRLVRLPRRLLKALAHTCWKLRLNRLSEIHGPLVDFLCHPPVLSSAKIKEAGFAFHYTTPQALHDLFRARGGARGRA